MPVQTSAEQGPGGALLGLRDAVRALHKEAGEPSYRVIASSIGCNEARTATASHNTVGDVLTGKRLTRLETLKLVVLQLHKDSKDPRPPDVVWPPFEALWREAKQERDHLVLPEPVRAFTTALRGAVIGPLGGDFDEISERLGAPAASSSDDAAVPAAALKAICEGTRVPGRRELECLLDLLDQDGRGLQPEARQALMVSYYDMLRACAPHRYADCMLRDECDAQRQFRGILEDRLHALEHRREREREAEPEPEPEPRETEEECAAPTRRPRLDAWLVKDELDLERRRTRALRANLARQQEHITRQQEHIKSLKGKLSETEEAASRARKDTADAQSLVLDMRGQRDELKRKNAEQAALLEVSATMAFAAEHDPPPVIPSVPMTDWDVTSWGDYVQWDVYDSHSCPYPVVDSYLMQSVPPEGRTPDGYALHSFEYPLYPPSSWSPAAPPDGAPPEGTLATALPSHTGVATFPSLSATFADANVTAHPEQGRIPAATSATSVASAEAVTPAPEVPVPRPKGPLRLLRAVFRSGSGRHARRK
ncbi:hypothetical protein [Streptomyces sp. NPDC046261]|uniref:hypothetical protein n=1 Tax=Streptomyces sp. NPDC046261 TaxID=3157200 RepID=UPI0033C7DED9